MNLCKRCNIGIGHSPDGLCEACRKELTATQQQEQMNTHLMESYKRLHQVNDEYWQQYVTTKDQQEKIALNESLKDLRIALLNIETVLNRQGWYLSDGAMDIEFVREEH